MHYLEESHILLFLVQLLILLGCARGLGEVLRRWKQPALTAEILVGIVLGPTIFGRFLPDLQQTLFPQKAVQQAMLDTVAWLGVLLLLLDTGLEIDFSIAWRQRGKAFVIALTDIIVPIAVAFAAVIFLPGHYMVNPDERLIFALFMATVMTISALPVAARVLHDVNMLKADLGFLIMSALTVNDIIGWVLFTVILGIFTTSTAAFGPIAFIFTVTVGFAALALTVGRRISGTIFAHVHRKALPEPGTSLTITVLLGLMLGAFTQKLGIHALFGFFIAGVIVGEAKHVSEQTRGIISQMVHSLFVPLFFANIGLKIDFVKDFDFFLVALICGIGIFGRYFGAWLGATLSNVPRINRDIIGIAHTPGGMMEIVVALLALESGLITETVFVAIVFSAVFSSVLMGPWMARSLARRREVSPAEFLAEHAVIPELNGSTPPDVIRELVDRATHEAGSLDRATIVNGAMAREKEFSTAIGNGIAIPHARLDGLSNPVLAYGHASRGIEWNEPDGIPVEDVFFLGTPAGTDDVHVQVLAGIATAMTVAGNRSRIHGARSSGELHSLLQKLLSGEKPAEKATQSAKG